MYICVLCLFEYLVSWWMKPIAPLIAIKGNIHNYANPLYYNAHKESYNQCFSINTEILWAINLKWYIYKLVHLNTRQNHTKHISVPTPPPLSHLQKTEEQETRKQGKSAGPTAMLLWILAGIIRLKIWTALRLFDELKIIPTSFGFIQFTSQTQ